jgi:phospholipid transport system substrate-binding protein
MTNIRLIRYILIVLATLAISSQAQANVNGAQAYVRTVSDNALKIIKDGNIDDKKKEQKLIALFENVVDTKWIARFVLGSNWNSATEAQKSEYVELHHKFLINSYIPKFKQYTNQKIDFKKVHEEGNLEYMVETEITQPDKAAIRVDYKVREDASGKYKIYDVVAEGVSLITTQRSDFASILSRGGLDDLIKKLRDKVKG